MKRFFTELGRATLVGLAIYVVFLGIYFFMGREITLGRELGRDFLEHMLYSWVIYLANAYVFLYVFRHFGPRIFHWKNLGLSLLATVTAGVHPGEQRRPGAADVQVTRGAGSEAKAYGHIRVLSLNELCIERESCDMATAAVVA